VIVREVIGIQIAYNIIQEGYMYMMSENEFIRIEYMDGQFYVAQIDGRPLKYFRILSNEYFREMLLSGKWEITW
jgi:hypothetical protein